ncbi:hypothetical protein D5086_029441 [Populus alba]|uniref:Uncharacterized protein n=1 Tax=Populus alba TaxID=43335 RepID=A0ACC4AU33_POPAL
MTSFLAEIQRVYSPLSQESQNNLVCINWTFLALDIQVGMTEGQHWQIARFDFESCDFHALPYFIVFLRFPERPTTIPLHQVVLLHLLKGKEPLQTPVKIWARSNDDTVQPCDMTQVRSDRDFGVKSATVQVNRSSGRNNNTGQRRLYGFCYLLPFDLWTSYLVSIVSHSYQTSFGFPGSDLNLDCGLRDHVITRFASPLH